MPVPEPVDVGVAETLEVGVAAAVEESDPVEDAHGFVYERSAIESYILQETGKRLRVGGRSRAVMAPMPPALCRLLETAF